MRRFVSLLLIFCVLILVAQTCDEVATASVEASAVSAQSNYFQTSVHDPSDTTDKCSPFCICSCRQVPSLQENHAELPERVVDPISSREIQPHRVTPHGSSFTESIWQPPKA
ncbi:MAG: hypothetical protein ABI791_15980 [Acidobacteriota bacterium]